MDHKEYDNESKNSDSDLDEEKITNTESPEVSGRVLSASRVFEDTEDVNNSSLSDVHPDDFTPDNPNIMMITKMY